ncbi:MAG: Divalent-cation tolerance protein CutA [Alphaproteobacteria bacterium MarineAlpha9_Bin4]|nr:MAG: Divalent-cation tolerance protein CutA [Alphaproteobacteria bacterium MarineAlpha9_Bin4]|tara:strand:+ start:1300 stop:1608 length:309 start_codon:yes stop_codon:yes gene_type:complete
MIIIKTTSDNLKTLEKISEALLKKELAGCINILSNCNSYFIWETRIQKNKEYIAFIKSKKSNEKKIYNFIKKNHNYETPEILTIKVDNVDNSYLNWLKRVII